MTFLVNVSGAIWRPIAIRLAAVGIALCFVGWAVLMLLCLFLVSLTDSPTEEVQQSSDGYEKTPPGHKRGSGLDMKENGREKTSRRFT